MQIPRHAPLIAAGTGIALIGTMFAMLRWVDVGNILSFVLVWAILGTFFTVLYRWLWRRGRHPEDGYSGL